MITNLLMNTDLGGADGFVEIVNIECYTLSSNPVQFFMSAELSNEFTEEVF